MKFIRGFKNLFSNTVYTIFIVAIAVFSLVNALGNNGELMPFLASFVPLVLILISAVGLQLKGKTLAAHLVLILTVFLGAGRAFIYAITSFDFSTLSFSANFSIELIIAFVIFAYLFLVVASHLLVGKTGAHLGKSPILISATIAFLYFFFRDGFSVAVLKILPPLVALMFGSDFFAIVLLLAGVADVPFILLDHIFLATILQQPISYFLFTAFGLYLIYGAIMGLLKYKR